MKAHLKKLILAAMQAGTTGNPFVMQATLDAADQELEKLFPEPPKTNEVSAPIP